MCYKASRMSHYVSRELHAYHARCHVLYIISWGGEVKRLLYVVMMYAVYIILRCQSCLLSGRKDGTAGLVSCQWSADGR